MGIISNIFYLKVSGQPDIPEGRDSYYSHLPYQLVLQYFHLVLIILYYVVYGGIILCITLDYPYLPNPCMRLRSIA